MSKRAFQSQLVQQLVGLFKSLVGDFRIGEQLSKTSVYLIFGEQKSNLQTRKKRMTTHYLYLSAIRTTCNSDFTTETRHVSEFGEIAR